MCYIKNINLKKYIYFYNNKLEKFQIGLLK